jgi:formate dehydrogenase iron-sulfur subunit
MGKTFLGSPALRASLAEVTHADTDPAALSGHDEHPPRMGFFTDTSVCIGCKACEVACKEWNNVPETGFGLSGMSYDNTVGLGADAWRHVAFIEQRKPVAAQLAEVGRDRDVDLLAGAPAGSGTPPTEAALTPTTPGPGREGAPAEPGEFRWLMSSDVCKHCTHAACLDVCPTGALVRTEFGTVIVQEDVCNGCGYCIPACPYGVIDQREDDGRAFKCTLCYDRLSVGAEPACAKACPTDSIQFGVLDELRERAEQRVQRLHDAGVTDARLYGHRPDDGVGGDGAFFLLLDAPEVYGLPPDPVVTTRDLPAMWKHVGMAAVSLLAMVAGAVVGRRS